MQSGVSAAILFIWKVIQNPASLNTGGTKKKTKNQTQTKPQRQQNKNKETTPQQQNKTKTKHKQTAISLPFTPNLLRSTLRPKTDSNILPKPRNNQTPLKLSSASVSSVIPSTPLLFFFLQQQTYSPHL